MAQANTFQVRGGRTDAESEYGEGVPYYDTVSGIAKAWKEANPEDPRSLRQVQRDIVLANRLKTRNGVACTGDNIQDAVIRVGQTLVLPAGNPVNPELHYDCPPERRPRPREAVREIDPVTPATVVEQAPATPLAQFVPAPSGAVDLGYAMQRYNYYFGNPPRDVAATGSENAGRLRNGAIVPDEMEGQAVNLRRRDDTTGALREGQEGKQFFGRARGQELTYAPENTYMRGANGQLVPNRRYNQKLEENLTAVVDGDGRTIEAVMGGALISLARRNNPYHAGIFTDYDTARNVIGRWNATAEAVTVITQYQGLTSNYETVANRFFNAQAGAATAADARALLEMNEQLALNPVVWSVSSRGVPVADISVVQNASRQVFESPAFQALPAEEQQALRSTHEARIAQYGNPQALFAAVGGQAGIDAQYNPLSTLSTERAQLDFIQRGYGRDGGNRPARISEEEWAQTPEGQAGEPRPRRIGVDAWRTQVADTEGQRYAAEVRGEATRVPHPTEVLVGTGLAFDRSRQTADAVVASRREALTTIRNDQALLDDVITHVVTAQNPSNGTATALQKWTDPLFHASRAGGDREELLAFTRDRDADRFAETTAEQLGGRQYRDAVDYRGNSVLNAPIGFVASLIGQEQPGGNRNQNRGVADGFPQAVRERWVNGTDEDRAQIRQAFGNIIDRSLEADANGQGYAAASLITSLNPRLAEYSGRGATSEAYQRVQSRIGTAALDSMILQANGTEQLGAELEAALETRVARGQNIQTVASDTLNASLQSGAPVTVTGTAANPAGISATVLNTDQIRAAVGQAAQAGVILVANNPDRIGQGDVSRHAATLSAATDPAAFSMTLLAAGANDELDAGARRNLGRYLNTVDKGTGDANRYADMMKHHLRAYERAGSDPAALLAAEQAAAQDLQSFFATADNRHAGSRVGAASRLADLVAGDNALSAGFSNELRAIAAQPLAAGQSQLPAETVARLQAIQASSVSPEEKAAQVRALVGGAPVIGSDTLNAGTAAGATTGTPALNAGQTDQLVALVAGGNRTPEELAAGIRSITAGADGTSTLNADQQRALASVLAGSATNPDELRSRLQEFNSVNSTSNDTLNARPGVSWRNWAKVIAIALIPGGDKPDTPFNPVDPEGCGTVLRPICPDRPMIPNMPNMPSIPGR